jgi:glycosyltransferase involved in cell wall biosynthesis
VASGTRPRIALAHDWLVGYRGGEAVLDAIARLCENRYEIAGVYTMFDDGRGVTPAIDRLPKVVSSLNRLPAWLRRWMLPAYPLAVRELSSLLAAAHAQSPIDLVISTSSAAIKGLMPPRGVPHVCYCHSPARYLWSQGREYASGRGGRLRGLGLGVFGGALRDWDRTTSSRVTTFIANSTHTANEIRRCYGRDAAVVHPPVRTRLFVRPPPGGGWSGWLYVGALEPYKRVDLAVRAAARESQRLTVVGTGTQESDLRARAGPSVEFTGRIGDGRLLHRYWQAQLLVFPQVEDFGIVAVEAQACGVPVVAFRAGGALDSVIEGKTGVFFDEATPEALADAVRRCVALGDVAAACRANAERFSEDRFEREMLAIIESHLQ